MTVNGAVGGVTDAETETFLASERTVKIESLHLTTEVPRKIDPSIAR